ncbi:MAG: rhamnan synthesis F family protein [Desulfuromonadaceae bacterium]|nr:rhamnan synthesis F family protein [Desulfuromonas sp.]MDY0185606.1 rhamnan synthesis F family protein [Desulfuromonadaceae bacterium]
MPGEFAYLLNIAHFSPLSLTRPLAWVGHMPFAYWLVQTSRPRILVELGTHAGNSYFAFCQGIQQANLATRCYAIDTWQGDEHAGNYSEDVYSYVSRHNQEHYSTFSTLLRTTFETAVESFSPASIDLLHIDGLHTYAAAKHDFEAWLPKLAPGALVLFHDTMVREPGFGVWRLWHELQQQFPENIEFYHSNGLGVLQVGHSVQSHQYPWLQPNSEIKQQLRTYFAALGTQQHKSYLLGELTQRFDERGAYVDELNRAMENSAASIAELNQNLEHKNAEIDAVTQEASAQLQETTVQLQEAIHARDLALQQYAAIAQSSCWKLSYPLRRISQKFPALRRYARRTLELVWWTLTGQILRRLRHPQDSPSESPLKPPPAEVARPPEDDSSLAVPFLCFGADPQASECEPAGPISGPIAVICHLFHADLAGEIRNYLSHIPYPFDLYISTDTTFKRQVIAAAFSDFTAGLLEIRVLPNRGRDIAPKLIGFADVYPRYTYILHLHSKHSSHAGVLEHWRGYLLETLLGSPAIVRSVFAAFEHQPDLGIIAAQHFEPVRHWINWGGNLPCAQQLAERLGFNLSPNQVLDFPSGSMFWARSAALQPLLDASLDIDDFAIEAGQIDATLAHAIERLYFYICESAGYQWLKIARPDLLSHTPAIQQLQAATQLPDFFAQHGFRLTAATTLSRRSPLAPVAAPAPALIHALQRRALGTTIQLAPQYPVAIGIVTYNNPQPALNNLVQSALIALEHAGLEQHGRIYLIDNGHATAADTAAYLSTLSQASSAKVEYLPTQGNTGFGTAHNQLMSHAFNLGAEIYIAANPDGAFHPETVFALAQMMHAHQHRALIEALQFPAEHPKPYDSTTFVTPWVSGACLAIPRAAYTELAGFDPQFFMYCEDVDLSWRARAHGFALLTCPRALFLHEVTNRPYSAQTVKMIYTSGVLLARKWVAPDFESWLSAELRALGHEPPTQQVETVPVAMRHYADFSHQFSFAKPRW